MEKKNSLVLQTNFAVDKGNKVILFPEKSIPGDFLAGLQISGKLEPSVMG